MRRHSLTGLLAYRQGKRACAIPPDGLQIGRTRALPPGRWVPWLVSSCITVVLLVMEGTRAESGPEPPSQLYKSTQPSAASSLLSSQLPEKLSPEAYCHQEPLWVPTIAESTNGVESRQQRWVTSSQGEAAFDSRGISF